MNTSGFYLTRLTLKGPNVPAAEILLQPGLNAIVGASDTGKTFIAHCMDFMFGRRRSPKKIPEAVSYESVFLGLKSWNTGNEMVLERSLQGGDFRLLLPGNGESELAAVHQAGKENTVSHFFLELSGLSGKRIRTNKIGKTRALSFRDISKLVLVDETSVISERSPIVSGQHGSETAEISVFRLLLTGGDDSSIISREDPKVSKGRREGKVEVIEELLDKAYAKVRNLEIVGSKKELLGQLTNIDVSIRETSQELETEQKSAVTLENNRRAAWESLRRVDSRLVVLAELQKRFALLQEQYSSDLRRLETISEASIRLAQMKEDHCPVCGAPAEYHDIQNQSQDSSPEDVANSCRAEADKIGALLTDLRNTIRRNGQEIERLQKDRQGKQKDMAIISSELEESLQPHIQAVLQKLRDSQTMRDNLRHAIELFEQISELELLLHEIKMRPRKKTPVGLTNSVGTDEAEDFSRQVESLLRSWHFPNLERVTFSEEDQDVVISGERRASHGKGVRAITHSAFNLALLQYCQNRSMPHPGIVLIDSPLVVYRQPDADEKEFPLDVKEEFYRTLAREFANAQVIILDNDYPPDDLYDSINLIKFTGTNRGRRGFIPN